MCSGSEAGSYLRLIDFVYHSTLGLRVIKKKTSVAGETVRRGRRPPGHAAFAILCGKSSTEPLNPPALSMRPNPLFRVPGFVPELTGIRRPAVQTRGVSKKTVWSNSEGWWNGAGVSGGDLPGHSGAAKLRWKTGLLPTL